MEVTHLVRYAKFLYENFIGNQALSGVIQSFQPAPAAGAQRTGILNRPGTNVTKEGLRSVLNVIQRIMSPLYSASDEQRRILHSLGGAQFADESFYSSLYEKLEGEEPVASIWQALHSQLSGFSQKVNHLYVGLRNVPEEETAISIDSCEIEVVFQYGASIDNIVEARRQFSRWYQIIEGYARLKSIAKEDYSFIAITKASPTRLRIRVPKDQLAVWLAILTGLFAIEERLIGKKVLIEQIRSISLTEEKRQSEFVDEAERDLKREAEDSVKKLAEDVIGKEKAEPEAHGFMVKSVENQYVFISNGGTINVTLPSGENRLEYQMLQDFERMKQRLQETERRLEIMRGEQRKELDYGGDSVDGEIDEEM